MKFLTPWRGHILVLASAVALFCFLPLRTAFLFEVDEGYEAMKALLYLRGFPLYTEVWDDQPPLFTMFLAGAFKIAGISIFSARLVVVAFAILMLLTFYQMVRLRTRPEAALLATFLLIASPITLKLCVSAMQEVPTVATALLASLFVFHWCEQPQRRWLFVSGAVMGVALQIKLTAAIFIPAIAAEICSALWAKNGDLVTTKLRLSIRPAAVSFAIWGISAAVVFTGISVAFARGSFQSSWKAHMASHAVAGIGDPQSAHLRLSLLQEHAEAVVAAVAGLALLLRRRMWRIALFPTVLLLTSAAIHSIHRPWWNYYYLHLAVPLAWLGGIAIFAMLAQGSKSLFQRPFAASTTALGIFLLLLAAFILARSEIRLERWASSLQKTPRIQSSPIVKAMLAHSDPARWAYSDLIIYPFHAKLSAPPEIAVVTLKRFWSGQITTNKIVNVCERYRPEQLVLPVTPDPLWTPLLSAHYSLICTDANWGLYLAKPESVLPIN